MKRSRVIRPCERSRTACLFARTCEYSRLCTSWCNKGV